MICISCNRHFDTSKKLPILKSLVNQNIHIQNDKHTCLICLQRDLQLVREQQQASVNQASLNMQKARKAYNTACITQQKLTDKYRKINDQEAYLSFYMKRAKPTQAKTKATKKKTTRKKSNSKINLLLAGLTSDQLAIITEQAKAF